ncbi:MAG: Periplasmic serine endoprotease DegP [Chlamydiae bacterium]|nr:Periplasmic serine endoprotease DegP [Chlamydiota bacterium]
MKRWMCGILFSTISLFASPRIEDSIVKIYSTVLEYNYQIPWSPPTTDRYTGSGFIIEGNLILTNAHVVTDASFIEVRSGNSNERYEAFVKVIGHDCDLAVLEVEDPKFFEGKEPLKISKEIALQREEVQVYGFPMGGVGLSITKGIISRIEIGSYIHSNAQLLISQIDAPINPGNSGGPVIAEGGEVVGIAHQGFRIGQSIGYMIPIPIINHFLKEVEEGSYRGFPKSSMTTQVIRNQAMRDYYSLDSDMGGLLVKYVPENYFLHDILRPGDVLVGVDGHMLDRFGYIEYDELNFRLPFSYLILMKYFGDEIELDLLRDGEMIHLTTQVDFSLHGAPLVKEKEFDKAPTYFILGGMVFHPLVGNFLDYSRMLLFPDLTYERFWGKVNDRRDEVVILARVLGDMVNTGYQHLENEIVEEVNGHPIRNIRDMIDIFESCDDPYYTILTKSDTKIILDRERVLKRNSKILQRYFIPSDRSADLRGGAAR